MTAAISLADLQNALLDVQTIATCANGVGPTVTSRLGATFPTLQGLLASIGYLPPVNYASGLVVSSTLYTVVSGGLIYAPLPSLVPFTTSGAFNPAQWFLIQVAPSAFVKTLLPAVDAPTFRGTLGAAASGANTDINSLLLNNAGLLLKDIGGSFALELKPGSTLTANRILTITTGDVARTLDLSAASIAPSAFVATLLDDTSAANFMTTLGMSAFFQGLIASADAPTFRSNINDKEVILMCQTSPGTALTVVNGFASQRMPYAFQLTEIPRVWLAVASSSGLPTIRINKNGTSILSTLITVDATELTSKTAATPGVLTTSPTNFADDDLVTADCTVAGTGAKGAIVALIGKRTS